MFQAIRKIAGRSANEENRSAPPTGVQVMDQSLKKKYARGVQYNSKSKLGSKAYSISNCVSSGLSLNGYCSYIWTTSSPRFTLL